MADVILDSSDSGPTSLGTITFNGAKYSLPQTIAVEPKDYEAEYTPAAGYEFDYWYYEGGVTVANMNANPANVTVSDEGLLVAVFKETPTYRVGLESHDPWNFVWSAGTTIFNGTAYDLPVFWLGDVAPGNYSAQYLPEAGFAFISWTTGGGLTVADLYANPVEVTVFGEDGVLVAIYLSIPTIESCDASGVTKNSFAPGEAVYVKGSNFTTYPNSIDVMVVGDTTWSDGMSIPSAVVSVPMTPDDSGNLAPILLWSSATPGAYDIVADANTNDSYEIGKDALDDFDVDGAGFFVVPEFWLGTILGLGGCFAALGVFLFSKRKNK